MSKNSFCFDTNIHTISKRYSREVDVNICLSD